MRAGPPGAHDHDVAPARTSAHDSLAVELACRVCGRPILLMAADDGTEIADRAAFLRDHLGCLIADLPAQPAPPDR